MLSDSTEDTMVSNDFRRQVEGYGLTTAHILYRLPDHPSLLQTYVWQEYDLCPKFPVLNKFLNFWLEKLEGPLFSITVAHSRLIKPAEIKAINGEFRLDWGLLPFDRSPHSPLLHLANAPLRARWDFAGAGAALSLFPFPPK